MRWLLALSVLSATDTFKGAPGPRGPSGALTLPIAFDGEASPVALSITQRGGGAALAGMAGAQMVSSGDVTIEVSGGMHVRGTVDLLSHLPASSGPTLPMHEGMANIDTPGYADAPGLRLPIYYQRVATTQLATAKCEPQDRLLGGGCAVVGAVTGCMLTRHAYQPDGVTCRVDNNTCKVRATAICVKGY